MHLSITNYDACPMLTERCEFYCLNDGSSHDEAPGGRCSRVRREVGEGPPIDELAEGLNWPGPVAAVGRRAGPEASLRVWLVPVGILIVMPASPALSLDWIDDVLPGDRWRDRHIDRGLEVGLGGTDVQAPLLPHRAQHRSEVMDAASRLAERFVRLAVRQAARTTTASAAGTPP